MNNQFDAKIQKEPVLQQVLKEVGMAGQEAESVRAKLMLRYDSLIPQIENYEKENKRKLIVYISKIGIPKGAITPDDIAPIGSMLTSGGEMDNLDLMIHGPGGSGVVAEKIVEMFRQYCKKEFRIIVPNMAKSAATLVALGADKIVMGYCSELGPIDAQRIINISGAAQQISVQSFITARENLLQDLHKAKSENKEYIGYLQQLASSTVEPAFIEECKRELKFSQDLVKKWLPQCMLKNKNLKWKQKKLKQKAAIIAKNLSSADKRFSHGRMIGAQECESIGLNIEILKKDDILWNLLWELYVRAEVFMMINSKPQEPVAKLFMDNQNYLLSY